jgi:hypothetical protein
MTLIYHDRFHFGAANGAIARFAAWVFLAVYVFVPTVGTWLFVREQRLAGTPPSGGPALPGWFKVAITAQGGIMIVFGAALYVAPAVFARAWPWTLTSLSGLAVGSWLVPIGLGNLLVFRENDLRRAWVPALTSVAYGLLQLGAIARYGDQVQWQEAGAWVWVALLISMIVTGGYGLLATSRAAKGEPVVLR